MLNIKLNQGRTSRIIKPAYDNGMRFFQRKLSMLQNLNKKQWRQGVMPKHHSKFRTRDARLHAK
jgi:hypothetical protein